jgi:hypothetical protein
MTARISFLSLLLMTPVAPAHDPPSLEIALKQRAATILQLARERGAKNIGVLKFLVRVGDKPPSDNVGRLNLALADRLTVALILACPDEEIGIIDNANEVLSGTRANHLDEEGRSRCFRARGFSLAWGDPQVFVRPDLFVTGVAHLSTDLKTIKVRFEVFGPDGKVDSSIPEIEAKTSAQNLIDTGHTYLITKKSHPELFAGTRGGEDEDLDAPAVNASQKFVAHLSGKEGIRWSDFESESPIRVTIFYGDQPVRVQGDEIPEPREGDKVWFRLENLSDEVHGVVLKINGENSIFREKLPDRECHKWILKPGGAVVIRGFQTSLGEREDFRVQSVQESREKEMRYGEHVGQFQITVFRAGSTNVPPAKAPSPPVEAKVAEQQEAVAAIARGVIQPGRIRPADLKSLQRQLRSRQGDVQGARGIIDADSNNPKPHLVEKTTFSPDPPIPVMSYTIRYYNPRSKK